MHDVAILHHIILSFNIQLTSLTYSCFAAIFDIVVILDDFSTDKTFLKVSMNYTSTLWSLLTFVIGPGSLLCFAGSDEGFQVQELEGTLDKSVHARFFQAKFF